MPARLRAPGIEFEAAPEDRSEADILRPDIVGFAGVFERGPIFVSRRVEDWGEHRSVFGGFLRLRGRSRRHALGPLALYGFQQNGGGTAIVVRLGARAMRAATATVLDPATGKAIGLVAASPGAWANKTTLRIPLRVRSRFSAAAFPLSTPLAHPGAIVRVSAAGQVALGTLDGALMVAPGVAFAGPYVVEVIEPVVDVTVEGGGLHERFRELSLLDESPRNVWRWLAVRRDLGPEWTPRIPASWLPLDVHLDLAIDQQGPAVSSLLRAVVLDGSAAPGTPRSPWPSATAAGTRALEVVLGDGVDEIKSMDAASYRAAIELLAEHPLPSVVAIPDLMLPFAPSDPPCAHESDGQRFPDPVPPPEPCAPTEPHADDEPEVAPEGLLPAPEVPEPDDLPTLASAGSELIAIAMLQTDLLNAVAEHGDGRAERVALIDARPGLSPSQAIAEAASLSAGVPRPELGAVLYPWVYALDPATAARTVVRVPPSGHVAGLMARTTRGRGPSAPFANQTLNGVVAAERVLDNEERVRINFGQVCVVHTAAGKGVLLFGERSMSHEGGALAFVPPSRVLAYVRRVLRVVGQTLVFEPNDRFLWLRIKVTLEAALQELFAASAFAGRTAAESYRVRCDETTNPRSERDAGRVITLVHVALAVPLEFITIRIAFTRDGARVLDDVSPAGGA